MQRSLTLCFLAILAISLPAETFRNPRHIPIASNPNYVGTADFNNDGLPDFYYYSDPGVMNVLLAQSGGTYNTVAPTPLVGATGGCRTYDINADNLPDLICVTPASATSSFISTFLGKGDGTFQSPRNFVIAAGASPYSHGFNILSFGDLNHDGHTDVALLDSVTSKILGLLGDGAGNFTMVQSPITIYGLQPPAGSTLLVDLNGDGNLDLLFSQGPVTLFGNGDGTFTRTSGPYGFSDCVFGDLDQDGHLDAVGMTLTTTATNFPASLVILHGNSDGSFNTTPIYSKAFPFYDFISPVAVRDLNHDGYPDILALSGDGLAVFLGQPGLQFAAPAHYAFYNFGGFNTGQGNPALIADYNHDGQLDLAMPGANGIYITYGRADGTFDVAPPVQSGTNVGFAASADFNGDGIPDVVTSGSAALQLNLGKGDGTFAPSIDIQTPAGAPRYEGGVASRVLTGDFNGDGHPDLIATDQTTDSPSLPHLFLGHGDGYFAPPVLATSSLGYVPISSLNTRDIIADFNQDGRDDLAAITAINSSSNTVGAFLSNGDGTFNVVSTSVPLNSSIVATGDFNADGKPDLVLASSGSLVILLGKGDGSFTSAPVSLPLPLVAGSTYQPGVMNALSGDFDHDGKLDIAILTYANNSRSIDDDSGPTAIVIYYGNGDGTFAAPITAVTLNHGYLNFAAADLNGDGLVDFVLSTTSAFGILYDYTGDSISVVHSLPNRTFSGETNLIAGNGLSSLLITDLNRDGFPDLIFANGQYSGNQFANTFTVLLNQGNTPTVTGTLTASPEPSIINRPFILTATLSPPAGTNTSLSGNITFTIDGNTVGSVPLTNNTVTLPVTTPLTIGTHQIAATWPGDSTYSSISLNLSHVVTGIPVTLNLSASTTTVAVGQQILLTTSVVNGPLAPVGAAGPTGTITLTDNGTVFGTDTSTTPGASFTSGHTFTTGGTHTIIATYSGDATHSSTTASVVIQVNPLATTLTLASSTTPAAFGTPVTFTATVTANPGVFLSSIYSGSTITLTGLPGGPTTLPVTFSPSGSTGGLIIGTATYTTSTLLPGSYTLAAAFSGNASLIPSASASLNQVISPVMAVTSLTINPVPAYQYQSVTISVGVTSSAVTPTGTVQLLDGSQPLATLQLAPTSSNLTAQATFSTTLLAPGIHTISAVYSGDASNLYRSTPSLNETILPSTFTLTLQPATLSLRTGHHTTLALTATSIGAFADTIRLSAPNLPEYTTIAFTPTTITLTAGSTAHSTLALDTDFILGYLSKNQSRPRSSSRTTSPIALALTPLALLLLPLVSRKSRRRIPTLIAALAAFTFLAASIGCSGKQPPSTPPGTYLIQITGTPATSTTQPPVTVTLPLTITP